MLAKFGLAFTMKKQVAAVMHRKNQLPQSSSISFGPHTSLDSVNTLSGRTGVPLRLILSLP